MENKNSMNFHENIIGNDINIHNKNNMEHNKISAQLKYCGKQRAKII